LLLGAGQLVCLLDADQVWIWNRHAGRARTCSRGGARGHNNIRVLDSTADAEISAWQRARH
jgi:hypothetical protein